MNKKNKYVQITPNESMKEAKERKKRKKKLKREWIFGEI